MRSIWPKANVKRRRFTGSKSEYAQYISIKDRVISYYQAGNREDGVALHRQVRELFFHRVGFLP